MIRLFKIPAWILCALVLLPLSAVFTLLRHGPLELWRRLGLQPWPWEV